MSRGPRTDAHPIDNDATSAIDGSDLIYRVFVTALHARLSMAITSSMYCRGRPPMCRSGTHHTGHSLFEWESTTGTPCTSQPLTETSALRTRLAHVADHSEYRS